MNNTNITEIIENIHFKKNNINNTFLKLFYKKISKDIYKCKFCSSNIPFDNILKNHNCLSKHTLNSNIFIHQIIHLSDIHIRINSRYDEYNHVFNNLYNSLENLKLDNKNRLIVICGDLLHSKSSLSPECILMAWNFLYKLSSYYPVILIAGNHDAILNNSNRIDSITAILKDRCLGVNDKNNKTLSLDNIYYLSNSGIYTYGNINFIVNSLLDNKFYNFNFIKSNLINNNINICLYHGSVGDININNFTFKGDKDISDFDGYDYTLLGDIHIYKYLNDNKNIAYSSSLISQNFTELDDNHGYILWDLENKKSEYIKIQNDYSHRHINYINEKIIINNKIISYDELYEYLNIKSNLRIYYDNEITIYDLIKNILNKYPDIKINKYLKDNTQNVLNNKNIYNKIDNIESDSPNNNIDLLLNNYINNIYNDISKDDKNFIIDKINNLMKKQNINNSFNNWKILTIKFDNMYGYGPNNIIDFDKYDNNTITGIFAPNSYGKSSLLDIITFCLFSSSAREDSNMIPLDIINNNSKYFNCEILFKHGNDIYLLIKSGKKFDGKTKNCNNNF